MSLHTNLQGRLRNTNLPKSHGLLPIYEAVVNSIHSIEERLDPQEDGLITLKIIRDGQGNIDAKDSALGAIVGFLVSDNGVGFDDSNMRSFETLDSEKKISKGCRGVGRLLWLKSFESVSVESEFMNESGACQARSFVFNAKNGVVPKNFGLANGIKNFTKIHLNGFKDPYQESCPKSVKGIADALLEHCLWYFVRASGAPNLIVSDDVESINLNDLYEGYMHSSAKTEFIDIKETKFELTHIKFRASAGRKHSISFCAANRLVKEEFINGKIPGLHGKIKDESGEFVYSCYVTSEYLDQRVRSERTDFDIAEEFGEIFNDSEISFKEIRDAVVARAGDYLKDFLGENIKFAQARIDDFISQKAPRYRPIISHISSDDLDIDPNISDKDLELHLHKQLVEIERGLLIEGHEILELNSSDDYRQRLAKYLKSAEDIKKSDLASYVSHRRVIIDLLERAVEKMDDGRYAREELIHELIMPLRTDSNEASADVCNLWIVDERLAFHDYLASDKTLNASPITNDSSSKEPDLFSLSVFDNPLLVSDKQSLPLASINVVEIKRPMRNDAKSGEDKDPIEQALGYLERIRRGGVTTAKGRPIPNSLDIPGYCYVICDLTPSIIERCRYLDLNITSDHMGYFGFHKAYKAYIEVISFDGLVRSAKERNRAFFDKLGLPSA